jgi:hypothetical protein
MFEADRIFYIDNRSNGNKRWYFQTREGIAGVYDSMEVVQFMLKEYIKECIESGNTGRRNPKSVQNKQITFKFLPKSH